MAYLSAHVVENGVEAYEYIEQLLSKPSIPSNLDEAAEKFARDDAARMWDIENKTEEEIVIAAFKAGAELMAGQGISMLGRVGIYGVDVESITKELREAGFNLGEEIVLQIRKKQ